jgi:hypothetical protein
VAAQFWISVWAFLKTSARFLQNEQCSNNRDGIEQLLGEERGSLITPMVCHFAGAASPKTESDFLAELWTHS